MKSEVIEAIKMLAKEKEIPEEDYSSTMFSKIYGAPKIFTPYKKLTDQSAEYLTQYRKIVHDKIVVIDFEITNTIEFQIINDVSIDVENLCNLADLVL